MNLARSFGALLLIPFAAHAEQMNLTGRVYKGPGQPLPNAIVSLVGAGLKDTTDAQGAYSFIGDFSSIRPGLSRRRLQTISLERSELILIVENAADVRIAAFDANGISLGSYQGRNVPAGNYRFDLSSLVRTGRSAMVRASIGERARVFRGLSLSGSRRPGPRSLEPSARPGSGLAKGAAAIDTVRFEAGGFAAKTAGLASYAGALDATLERLASDLPEFSFFVAGKDGLFKLAQAFSGSEKGFGGDLRYGQTGAGSGLKGADKICEALAESSQPGSKAKGWRAFLSASADANGKQVDAIDRIGEGPWYDRLGRLIANDKAGLLKMRPAGDAEVINDLPNEFGVPNHRPDPTLPEVDNHLTMTGSDSLGRFYGPGSTCEDWTSLQARPGPRVGMSWPQAGSFPLKNWISEWDQTGCEAGFDLQSSTGAGSRNDYSVGKGGGYGGYYCFALIP